MKLQIYYHPDSLEHRLYPFFSEKPKRLQTLVKFFGNKDFPIVTPSAATEETLFLAHSETYVQHVKNLSTQGVIQAFINNTMSPYVQWYTRVSKGSYKAALVSVGGVCQAVDDVLQEKCQRAFCLTRPPGHHAGKEKGEGFCLFNNVAIGALHALDNGAKRVAVIDFDRHHGNGTEEILHSHENVLFVSSFQEGCKYAHHAKQRENTVAISIPEHSSFDVVKELYIQKAIPAIEAFKPDLILISAGFDMHIDDPLTNIKLHEEDFYTLTQMLVALANKLCDGKIVSSLEGGYDVDALKECTHNHLKALEE